VPAGAARTSLALDSAFLEHGPPREDRGEELPSPTARYVMYMRDLMNPRSLPCQRLVGHCRWTRAADGSVSIPEASHVEVNAGVLYRVRIWDTESSHDW